MRNVVDFFSFLILSIHFSLPIRITLLISYNHTFHASHVCGSGKLPLSFISMIALSVLSFPFFAQVELVQERSLSVRDAIKKDNNLGTCDSRM
jgi:hypothetical protein